MDMTTQHIVKIAVFLVSLLVIIIYTKRIRLHPVVAVALCLIYIIQIADSALWLQLYRFRDNGSPLPLIQQTIDALDGFCKAQYALLGIFVLISFIIVFRQAHHLENEER